MWKRRRTRNFSFIKNFSISPLVALQNSLLAAQTRMALGTSIISVAMASIRILAVLPCPRVLGYIDFCRETSLRFLRLATKHVMGHVRGPIKTGAIICAVTTELLLKIHLRRYEFVSHRRGWHGSERRIFCEGTRR